MRSRNKAAVAVFTGMVLAGLSAPTPASAFSILASSTKNSGDRGAIIEVDPTTGVRTVFGDPTPGSEGLTSLEFDGSRNLWGTTINGFNTTSRLLQINASTGALVNDVGLIHTNTGDVAGSSLSIGDLAYDATTDRMFAVTANTSDPFGGGDLYTIDTGTGLATFIAQITIDNPNDADPAFAHDYSAGGLAFKADGSLWFTGYDITEGAFGTNMLFELDSSTGLELSRVELDRNITIFHGLGVNPYTQELYATEANNGSFTTGGIYHIALDGTTTLVSGDTLDGNTLSDIVFVSEPGTLAVLGLGIAGMAFYRRRRAG